MKFKQKDDFKELYQRNIPIFYRKLLQDLAQTMHLRRLLEERLTFENRKKIERWAEHVISLTQDQLEKFEFPSKYFHIGSVLGDYLTSKFLKDNAFNVSFGFFVWL